MPASAVEHYRPFTGAFPTRHRGAREWAETHGLNVDVWVNHLDISSVNPDDIVIGTLPIHLAAELQVRGARYLHLSLDLPAELQGRELSAEQMNQARTRIEEYRVIRIEQDNFP